METLNYICNLFLWLMIYSFIGWVYETILCSFSQKKFVYRGFLNGPICPIYGFGAMIMIMFLNDVGAKTNTNNIISLFLAGGVACCALEYVTSYVMEKLFHARWWDYSKRKFNLNGRICLEGFLAFATLGILLIKFIHPFTISITSKLSNRWLYLITLVLFVILITDLALTVSGIMKMNNRLAQIQADILKIRDALPEELEEFKKSLKAKTEKYKFTEKRFIKAFPKMQSTVHFEAFENIKKKMEQLKTEKRILKKKGK